MGQQQLLLLVISVILVGIATLAAYEALERGFRQDEADGLLDRALSIGSYAVQWKSTRDPFNGGNMSYEGLEGELWRLGMNEEVIRGRFAITEATPTTLEIVGVSTRYEFIGVRLRVEGYEIASTEVAFDGTIALSE